MENKKHGIFNVFDLVLIGTALLLAAALLILHFRGAGGGDSAATGPIGGLTKITYTVEFTVEDEEWDMIHVGDRMVDKIQHYNLGEIRELTSAPAERNVVDYERGEIVRAPIPGYTTLTAVVTADARVTDTSIKVDGGYELRIGTSVNAMFPGYNKSGTVIAIERGQAE